MVLQGMRNRVRSLSGHTFVSGLIPPPGALLVPCLPNLVIRPPVPEAAIVYQRLTADVE